MTPADLEIQRTFLTGMVKESFKTGFRFLCRGKNERRLLQTTVFYWGREISSLV